MVVPVIFFCHRQAGLSTKCEAVASRSQTKRNTIYDEKNFTMRDFANVEPFRWAYRNIRVIAF